MKAAKVIAIMALVFGTIFLPSCSCGRTEKKEIPTKIIKLKVMDIVQITKTSRNGYHSYTVFQVLLENGQMVTLGDDRCPHHIKESDIRKVMAFRRGETVYLTVEVPIETSNDVDIPLR